MLGIYLKAERNVQRFYILYKGDISVKRCGIIRITSNKVSLWGPYQVSGNLWTIRVSGNLGKATFKQIGASQVEILQAYILGLCEESKAGIYRSMKKKPSWFLIIGDESFRNSTTLPVRTMAGFIGRHENIFLLNVTILFYNVLYSKNIVLSFYRPRVCPLVNEWSVHTHSFSLFIPF